MKNFTNRELPYVSIVIPTLNRKKHLKNCLTSLYKMDYPKSKFEVIVVDNGCIDDTKEMVKTARLMPNPIFETSISNSDKKKTLSANKWNVDFGVQSLEDTLISN